MIWICDSCDSFDSFHLTNCVHCSFEAKSALAHNIHVKGNNSYYYAWKKDALNSLKLNG